MWFNEFPFLRYVIFFFFGISAYPWVRFVPEKTLFIFLLGTWLLYTFIVVFSTSRPYFPFKYSVATLAYLMLFFLGLVFCHLHSPHQQTHHIVNQKQPLKSYLGVVRQFDQTKPKTVVNQISLLRGIHQTESFPLSGELLLYHQPNIALVPGQLVLIKGNPQTIKPPSNPSEFDYQQYLHQQKITHQHFTKDSIIILGQWDIYPIEHFFIRLRSEIHGNITRWIKDPKAVQIAYALLLGEKKLLEKETQFAYATAGAMHVLAVSGLHVGIIYGFFFLFFKPLKLPLPRRILFLLFLIGLIWCYAFLTGLSASVLRSATMFTLMSFALFFKRTPSIFNPVAISAVLILMFDPLVGFSVGFQLSYAALIGILLFQPLILKLWLPKHKVLEYFWQITSVSLAAQIGTLPISIYYFHVFPTYFIIANWIVIPAAFLIMAIGIPFMLFSLISDYAFVLGNVLNQLLIFLNGLIFEIAQLPFAQLAQLKIALWEIVSYYLLLLLIFALWNSPSRRLIRIVVIFISLFIILNSLSIFHTTKKREVIVFGNTKGIGINYLDGMLLYEYYHELSQEDFNFKILPYQNKINFIEKRELKGIENQSYLLVFLPNQNIPLKINKAKKVVISPTPTIGFQFVNKDWMALEKSDSLYFHDVALKIKINE
jgi:competence protein ComEC